MMICLNLFFKRMDHLFLHNLGMPLLISLKSARGSGYTTEAGAEPKKDCARNEAGGVLVESIHLGSAARTLWNDVKAV